MAKKEKSKGKKSKKSKKQIPYHMKPARMTVEQWQHALRVQYGQDSKFKLSNLGEHPLFSDFLVRNPETGSEYKISIRGEEELFCSCLDFKTNQLGVCKHLSFAMKKLLRKRGHKKLIKEPYARAHSSIYIDYQGDRKVKICFGSKNRKAFQELAKSYFDEELTLTKTGIRKFEKFLEQARKLDAQFKCYDDAMEYVIQQRDFLKRQQKVNRLFKEGLKSAVFDRLIDATLYDYQKEGVLFAIKAGRCLLADDMGLGKTIQAIATAEFYKRYYKISRVIIVCPTSLKYQWKHEIERFTKSKAMVLEGNILKRRQLYENSNCFYHILGYRMAANDLQMLNAMEPDLVILDEAQRIKNWKTKTSTAIKKIRSPYAIVLTGTPIENKLEELYSIMQFIDVYRLGPLFRFLHQYQVKDPETSKVIGYRNLKEISVRLKDVLLRRTKAKVLSQMPKRQDKVLLVPMTEEQQSAHKEFSDTVARLVNKWRRMKFLNEADRKRLLLTLTQMRMVCDSTYLLDQTTRFDTKILELMCILDEYFDNGGDKVVIFSQWVRMQNIVAEELEERGIKYEYLHGGVPSKKRKKLLDSFREKEDCRVFLSTDAGGVGLNLQAASLVVNLDIPWNPAVLEQRIARVYRLGQKNPVQVINLVSAESIEHRMLDVLAFKGSVAKGVLDGGEDAIFLSDSKFNKLMDQVDDLTAQKEGPQHEESLLEIQEEAAEQKAPTDSEPAGQAYEHSEDITDNQSPQTSSSQNNPASSANALVQTGMSFLNGMLNTLQSPEKTKALVEEITAKDEQTGQTYLKIPIENEEMVSKALQVLGALFKK